MFLVELTVPQIDDVGILIDKIDELMAQEIEIIAGRFRSTYRTWTTPSKPEWTKTQGRLLGKDLVRQYTTKDFPYVWVNNGTPRGQVKFSDDYRPMTTPRVIGSKNRRGKVLFRGRFSPWTTGIKAREFDIEIAERRQPKFAKKMQTRFAINIRKFIRHGPTGQKQVIVL